MNAARQKVEAYVLKHLTLLDPAGDNTARYTELFKGMDDKAFDAWMRRIRDGEETLYIYFPNMKKCLKMEDIFKAADSAGIDFFERIWMYDEVTKTSYLTNEKYLVLRLPIRRMRQTLEHKRSIPESDRKIDLLSGQVVRPDKAAGISRIETQFMLAAGLKHPAQELVKYRGGDINAYAQLKRELEENGEGNLTLGETGSVARAAMMYQVFLNGMHIDANVV